MKKILSIFLSLLFVFTAVATPTSVLAESTQGAVCAGTVEDRIYGAAQEKAVSGDVLSSATISDEVLNSNKPDGYTYYLSAAKFSALEKAIDKAINNHAKEVYVYDSKIPYRQYYEYLDDTLDAVSAIVFDNPKFFHVRNYTVYFLGDYIQKIVFDYSLTQATWKKQLAACDEVANNMIADLKGAKINADAAALIIHDRLALWNTYDYDALDDPNRNTTTPCQTMYGALVLRLAVCEGYTMAYKYMLDKLGYTSYLCESVKLNHIWNIVRLNGIDYHVDVTWDDPDGAEGYVLHDNFLRSSDAFLQSHNAYDYARPSSSTRYDNFFWRGSFAEFQFANGSMWYLINDADSTMQKGLYRYDFNEQKHYQALNLSGDVWYATNGGYYYDSQARMDSDGTYLYISTPSRINRYDSRSGAYIVHNQYSFGTYNEIWGFSIDGENAKISVFRDGVKNYDYTSYNFRTLPTEPTLIMKNGTWRYVKNGQYSTATTLVKFNGIYRYVKKGVLNFTDNTLAKYNGKWYHVKDGRYVKDTTLVKYGSTYYYVKNGVKSTDNTLVKYGNKWYHVKGGEWVKDTTLVKYGGKWYYVQNGVKTNATTLVKYKGVWYYVKNGVKNTSNTLVKYKNTWYHVKGGQRVYDTTIVKYGGAKYYVKNGVMQSSFTGYVKISGKRYYIKKGKVV